MQALIQPDQAWLLWTVLLSSAALGLWVERSHWGARISGAIVTLLCSFLLTNLGVTPATSAVYDTLWAYLVPLAIVLLLYQASVKRIIRESGATLLAFVLGIAGVIAGSLVAYLLVPMGKDSWQVAAIFSANYIGDNMNYTATAEVLGQASATLLNAGLAADRLLMVLYLLILFSLPVLRRLRLYFNEVPRTDRFGTTTRVVVKESTHGTRMNLPDMATALALAMLICSVGFYLQDYLGLAGSALLFITIITVAIASLFPSRMERLEGTNELGTLIMQILFAVIGASAHVPTVLETGPLLFVFSLIVMLIHLLLIIFGGWYLKLSLPEIVIAANASLGNAATASAMAASRRWDHLIVPAILCGTLGYAIATLLGTQLGQFLQ